jgi:hypothetical protein
MAQEKKLKRDSGYSQSCREFQAIYATEFNPRFSKTTYSKMASDSENTNITMEDVVSSLKSFEATELFKLIKAATTEAEKKSKTAAKSTTKATSAKKAGSMPKGAVPPQLKKPRAWVEFTLKNALENGWESFTVLQKKKDKDTNTITEEQIEMPASILHNGAYIYADSVTEKTPDGRQIIHKEAMSLSKQRKESGHATYAEFEASYVDETDDDKSDAGSTASKKIVVKKTAAEKEAEAAAKKAEKEAAKAAAKAAKDAEKAAAKEAKDAEKAAAKAAKDAEKAAAKAAKDADKKPVVKAPVPAAAVKKTTKAVEAAATPVKKAADAAVAPGAPKKKPAAKVDDIPNDGMVHPCTIKGKKYLRNFDGETWTVGADGGVGDWAGLYNAASNTLDASAPEPVFDDDDE